MHLWLALEMSNEQRAKNSAFMVVELVSVCCREVSKNDALTMKLAG
jgi:hypothetical protein